MSRRRVWLEVSLAAITENFLELKSRVAPLKVMVVLKANAYGLGAVTVATRLKEVGADAIGVADLNEALQLVHLGLPIHILGNLLPEEVAPAIKAGVILPITDLAMAQLISQQAQALGLVAKCEILLDTGMGRLGIAEDHVQVIKTILSTPHLLFNGLYSHFPHAHGDVDFSNEQVRAFLSIYDSLKPECTNDFTCHMANSDGINNISLSVLPPFTMVRTGINLYGVHELVGKVPPKLKTALSLKSRLVAVRSLPQGATIGYDRLYQLADRMRIGTVCAGYADGVPVAVSNRGAVIIRDRLCPIVGKISMDYLTVSLESIPEAEVGDEVICIGSSESQQVRVEDWARMMGTSPYNIICGFGPRVQRTYSR